MSVVHVSRENWSEVDAAIAEHGVLMAVRITLSSSRSYDLSIGFKIYRLPENLAQELACEDKLSPTTYARLYLAGFRKG